MTRNLTWTSADLAKKQAKYEVVIGIDPGTHTGIAIKSCGEWHAIETCTIYHAIKRVVAAESYCAGEGEKLFIRIEDARKRSWFGNTGKERLKGAGSVERDCAIWEEVLTELKIPFEMVHPKNVKETTAEYFAKISGWNGRTSKHSREAAFLILNY